MNTWKHSRFAGYFAQIIRSTPIGTLSFNKYIFAVNFFLNYFKSHFYMIRIVIISELFFTCFISFFFDRIDRNLALLFGISKDRIFHTISSNFTAKF